MYIKDFSQCLDYINRLGCIQTSKCPGWIPLHQTRLCKVCDLLLHASGQNTWYHKEFKPFFVLYQRKARQFKLFGLPGNNSRIVYARLDVIGL